ncbi:hypothetical protein BKH42_08645 [Helicobacter sp. 13S00482-2]|uniref:hypothetical protein n=1 Tax=Helicobacter sp. 13S00482-2 TaxID=1476200 RepID=UPI000BA66724|nr:hypothetical protein [Helicobacter sp. 13S00482-2]PAF52931.1 hypothetical protein BKH42_08645 [Helicobacter sp. 13S00482-2]
MSSDFWSGWWWNELTRPNEKPYVRGYKEMMEEENAKQEYFLRVSQNFQKVYYRAFREELSSFEEGYQKAIQDAAELKIDKAQDLGFNSSSELADAIEAGKVTPYVEDGYMRFKKN